jgi:anaerobic ribonucleoside-triphosphate reductase activating protein
MLRYNNYDIVFQEIPNETTLAINLSNCPCRCKGCHSSYLLDDVGDELNEKVITGLLHKYGSSVTCLCFMGGDADPLMVNRLASFIKETSRGMIKVGWYSGRNHLSEKCDLENFDYIKIGAFIERLGGLDSETTNQRFYKIEQGKMIDQTARFRKSHQSLLVV